MGEARGETLTLNSLTDAGLQSGLWSVAVVESTACKSYSLFVDTIKLVCSHMQMSPSHNVLFLGHSEAVKSQYLHVVVGYYLQSQILIRSKCQL